MDWIKQLNEVTVADLETVELRLTQLNDEAIALRALKAVFRAKLGVKPEPVQAEVKAKPDSPVKVMSSAPAVKGTTAYQRIEAAKFLMQNGPTKPATICAECDIPNGSSTYVFNHAWFTRTDKGLELTQEGKRAATSAA